MEGMTKLEVVRPGMKPQVSTVVGRNPNVYFLTNKELHSKNQQPVVQARLVVMYEGTFSLPRSCQTNCVSVYSLQTANVPTPPTLITLFSLFP